ncbi:MAG: solute carrier family 23 protein [Coxiellaceae bacterium]|nr:solute carrier family 23 protein [Coxiellaceae bacterium]
MQMETVANDAMETEHHKTHTHGLIVSLTLQQVMIGVLGLAFSVYVFRQSNLTELQIVHKLQFLLLAFAFGCLLQSCSKRFIGSGLFLPPMSGAIYVQPSVLAIAIGGVPLMLGMTLFAGICEFILSFILRRTRFLFPPEICGLVMLLVGLDLGIAGFNAAVTPDYGIHLFIFGSTLIPIMLFSVWGKGYVRHICSVIGVLVGVAVVIVLHYGQEVDSTTVQQLSYVSLPAFGELLHTKMQFDMAMCLPFFMVAFAATLRNMGLTISVQQFKDAKWRRPDYPEVQRSIRADGLAAIVASLFGVNGINVSPTATTLAIASRFTKPILAVFMSAGFIILACFPKFLYYISAAPLAIVGAVLVYYAAFIFTGGVRTIGGQTFGIRQVYSIGIPFCLAISTFVFPHVYTELPYPFDVIGRSSLSIGLVSAVALNFLFYIGTFRSGKFTLHMQNQPDQIISNHMNYYGSAWRLKNDLVESAKIIARELCEQINHAGLNDSDIDVGVKENAKAFTMTFSYIGEPFKLSSKHSTNTKHSLDEEMVFQGIKTYLRGVYPDQVLSEQDDEQCRLIVTFNYL